MVDNVSGLTADEIVALFEADAGARRRLAELLVSEPDVRLAIINAVLRDVATKHDIERLRDEFKGELDARIGGLRRELGARLGAIEERINALNSRIDALDKRIDSLDKRIDFIAKVTLALTGAVLAALTATVIKLAITP